MSLYDLMVGNSMTAQKPDLGKAKPDIKMMANFGTKLPLVGAVTFDQRDHVFSYCAWRSNVVK